MELAIGHAIQLIKFIAKQELLDIMARFDMNSLVVCVEPGDNEDFFVRAAEEYYQSLSEDEFDVLDDYVICNSDALLAYLLQYYGSSSDPVSFYRYSLDETFNVDKVALRQIREFLIHEDLR